MLNITTAPYKCEAFIDSGYKLYSHSTLSKELGEVTLFPRIYHRSKNQNCLYKKWNMLLGKPPGSIKTIDALWFTEVQLLRLPSLIPRNGPYARLLSPVFITCKMAQLWIRVPKVHGVTIGEESKFESHKKETIIPWELLFCNFY